MSTIEDRRRDLNAEEVRNIPEVTELPTGARIVHIESWGTYDGTRYDGIDPSALYDCIFDCPSSFHDVASWFEARLLSLGWPEGMDVDATRPAALKPHWRRWERGKEHVDLIDYSRPVAPGQARPPEGWVLVRFNYYREPARAFSSEAEYQTWFNDDPGKGERWRIRGGT